MTTIKLSNWNSEIKFFKMANGSYSKKTILDLAKKGMIENLEIRNETIKHHFCYPEYSATWIVDGQTFEVYVKYTRFDMIKPDGIIAIK